MSNEPRTEAGRELRLAVLRHLNHDEWCSFGEDGRCACAAGQALIGLMAEARAEIEPAVTEALRRLNEPPFGHHIKGQPREGEGYCTCGYGFGDDDFDSMEEHIVKVVLTATASPQPASPGEGEQ